MKNEQIKKMYIHDKRLLVIVREAMLHDQLKELDLEHEHKHEIQNMIS